MYSLTVIELPDGTKNFRRNDGRLVDHVILDPDEMPVGMTINVPESCFDAAEEAAEDALAAAERRDAEPEEQTA